MGKIVGYYQSYKCYTTCKIDNIDPHLCTHLIYAFAGLENNKIKANDTWGDIEQGGYRKFNKLKNRNPRLKTLLAVGGWSEGSKSFSNMTSSYDSRKRFIKSCLKCLDEYGFDGIDLDWEYPCQRDGSPRDKTNFTLLVKEMASAFDERGYLLTAAVAAAENAMKTSYDVPVISKYLDFINLMTYDLHSASDGSGRVGHNAPLYSQDSLNVNSCVQGWLRAGADKRKLILGIAAYGRSFTLTDPNRHSIGSRSSGAGNPEYIDYTEIIEREKSGWKKEWDNQQQVPYIHKGDQWIGYDDPTSVKSKVQLAKNCGLGGIMMWSIDSDDPCGRSPFPLLNVIKGNF